jgi:hypothetical protein
VGDDSGRRSQKRAAFVHHSTIPYDRSDDGLRIKKNTIRRKKYGNDSFNPFNFIVSWGATNMALQQWVGILPHGRPGLALCHPLGSCLDGKNLANRVDQHIDTVAASG